MKYRIRCPPFLFPTPRSVSHDGTVLPSLGLKLVDATLESRIVEPVVVASAGRSSGKGMQRAGRGGQLLRSVRRRVIVFGTTQIALCDIGQVFDVIQSSSERGETVRGR